MKTVRMTQKQACRVLSGEIALKLFPGERVVGVHCDEDYVYAVIGGGSEKERVMDAGVEMLMGLFGMKE